MAGVVQSFDSICLRLARVFVWLPRGRLTRASCTATADSSAKAFGKFPQVQLYDLSLWKIFMRYAQRRGAELY
jgi:hypothetical protein